MDTNRILLWFSFFLVIFFLSCEGEKTYKCEDLPKGILKNMTGFDGCGWIIQLEDGTRLEPLNLNNFDIKLIDDKSICIKFREVKNYGSHCQVGKVIEIIYIHDN